MLKIYHNPRCSKSRAGLKFITDANLEHEVVEYLKLELNSSDIKDIVNKTGLGVEELIRTQESFYKSDLKGKSLSNEEWYRVLAEHPNLLHRPIVVKGNKAVFAQPPEKINELL